MCGIVGGVTQRNVIGILLEGLQRLEYRGYDSAGLSVLTSDKIVRIRRQGKVSELRAASFEHKPVGSVGIAHTRWATHGRPSEANAHPHMSGDNLSVVHNGIIENHEALRDELVDQGYSFTSETDTEVIAHLLDREIKSKGDFRAGVDAALDQLEGAYAIVVQHSDYPDRLIGARIGSPLVVGLGIDENFLASDPQALRPVTDRFIFLEEGELAEITANDVSIFGHHSDNVESRAVVLDERHDKADKGHFRHFMLKEIYDQPSAIRNTLQGRLSHRGVLVEAFGVEAEAIFSRVKALQIVACGTSFYSALVARYWFEAIVGIPCSVEIASELRYRKAAVLEDTLFVSISQSGETADTLAALKNATHPNYLGSLTICNVPNSSLVRESDLCLMLEAGVEICVASTKAFTNQLTDLLLLVIALGKHNGLTAEDEAALVKSLHSLPGVVESTLLLDKDIARLAEKFVEKHHALFLGRGTHFPIALEGALKLKEISYIHAEGYPSGELKHGPLALVDEHMPVIAVAPDNELLDKLKSNLEEVKARGGQLYVFAGQGGEMRADPGTTIISMPEHDEIISPIVYAIPMQLLAYHVAVMKGTDVDQPRNLAKSVTVE